MKQFEEIHEYDNDFKSINNKINITEEEQKDVLYKINYKMDRKSLTRKHATIKWKYYLALSTASLLLIILVMPLLSNIFQDTTGIFSKDESIRQILNELEYEEILYQEKVEKGVVVFYIPKIETNDATNISELSSIFIKKTPFGWEGTYDRGGYSSSIREDITSQYLPKSNSQSPFPMLYGEINNPEVNKIKIINSTNNNVYQAETVMADGHQIWFVFLDENQEVAYEVQGFSKTNEIITSSVLQGKEISDTNDKGE